MYAINGRAAFSSSNVLLGGWCSQLRVRELSSSSPTRARRTGIVGEYPRLPSVSLHKYRDWTSSQTTHSFFTILCNSLATYHHTMIICSVECFYGWRNVKQNTFSIILCVGFFSLRKILWLHSARTISKLDNLNHAPRMQSVGSMQFGRRINRILFVRQWKWNFGSFRHSTCLRWRWMYMAATYLFGSRNCSF